MIFFVFCLVYLSVVSLAATFVASFGVDIWNPRNVGSHSTDEKSRDQWVKRKVVFARLGMCMDINKIDKRLMLIKVSGKIEGPL